LNLYGQDGLLQFSQHTQTSAGSDRLRKAIERNRKKQAKKSSFAKKETIEVKPASHSQETQGSLWDLPDGDWSTSSSRRTTGKANQTEFATPLRQSSKAPAPVSYQKPTRATRKVATRRKTSKDSKSILFVVRLAWGFYIFLCFRLIFSSGGVVEYYSKGEMFSDKVHEKENLLNNNAQLANEIELIKKNRAYQKKLIREHLGFISKDEYLILFPSEVSHKSI